ncbi:unnamed protein product [Urochloa humidicola]
MEQEEDLARLIPDDGLANLLCASRLAISPCPTASTGSGVDTLMVVRSSLRSSSHARWLASSSSTKTYRTQSSPPAPSTDFSEYTLKCCMEDHCNSLLLHYECFINKATTGGRLLLPECPLARARMKYFFEYKYFAFDLRCRRSPVFHFTTWRCL